MQYSFDAGPIIKDLESDICAYRMLGQDLIVWGYWIVMPNGQEIFVDYYYRDDDPARFHLDIDIEYDEEDDSERLALKVADFDKKISEQYDEFFRKKMSGYELLEKLKEEDHLFG